MSPWPSAAHSRPGFFTGMAQQRGEEQLVGPEGNYYLPKATQKLEMGNGKATLIFCVSRNFRAYLLFTFFYTACFLVSWSIRGHARMSISATMSQLHMNTSSLLGNMMILALEDISVLRNMMDCFGTYFTHVPHVQRIMLPVFKVLRNGLLRYILHTCPKHNVTRV